MCSSVNAVQHAAVSLSLSAERRKTPQSHQQTSLQCLRVREGGRERENERGKGKKEREGNKGGGGR